jgi:SHS2 domain-containing protein
MAQVELVIFLRKVDFKRKPAGMKSKRYEFFEHTADIGLYIYGRDLQELFTAAAEALTAQLTDPGRIEPAEERRIELKEESPEELLRSWMTELLYLYASEGWLCAEAAFELLTQNSLVAIALGEKADQARHEITGEVKAVTWHKLKIKRLGPEGILRATVVLDV